MKRLLLMLLGVGVLIAASLVFEHRIGTSLQWMNEQTQRALAAVEAQDYAGSAALVDAVSAKWEEKHITWSCIMDHRNLEQVEIALSNVKVELAHEDQTLAETTLNELLILLNTLEESRVLTWANLF